MKNRLIAAILLLLFAFSVCTAALIYTGFAVGRTTEKLKKLRDETDAQKALVSAEQISREWGKSEKIISAYTEHEKVDEAGMLIKTLPSLIKGCSENEGDFDLYEQCEIIIAQLEHIEETEKPLLSNIF